MSHIDQLLRENHAGGVALTPDWAQGRATFGGLLGAVAHAAMVAQLDDDRPLRSLAVSFIAPASPRASILVEAEVLRQGKAVTQVESRVYQDDQVVLVALGSFGWERDSEVAVVPESAPEVSGPETARAVPFQEGITPAFLEHFEMRFAIGGFPFTGSQERSMGGWMRFREPPGTLTASHLVALVDVWPPAVLPRLTRPAPASTLSWSMELVHPLPDIAPDDWLLYRATIDQARDGYGLTRAAIWTHSGELVALSRQSVTVFA